MFLKEFLKCNFLKNFFETCFEGAILKKNNFFFREQFLKLVFKMYFLWRSFSKKILKYFF